MQITRSHVETQRGPGDWFTGDVYIDAVAAPAGTSTFAAALVHFTPGAPREAYFQGLVELAEGRWKPTEAELQAFFEEHDNIYV